MAGRPKLEWQMEKAWGSSIRRLRERRPDWNQEHAPFIAMETNGKRKDEWAGSLNYTLE